MCPSSPCQLPTRQEFLTGGIVFCYGLSLYLYRNSFRKGKHLLAKGGDTGNRLYDFFIGRELNPRRARDAESGSAAPLRASLLLILGHPARLRPTIARSRPRAQAGRL